MYQYHGWISIRYHTHDTNQELQDKCFSAIKELAKEYQFPFIEFFDYNGVEACHYGGQHNHKQDKVLNFFKEVGENSIGSFGVLTVIDCDNEQVQKYVLKRGKVHNSIETELSPFMPVVEDFYDETRDD